MRMTKIGLVFAAVGFLFGSCSLQPTLNITTNQWFTSTQPIDLMTFGYVNLHLAGTTSGDKVTVETHGDGLIDQQELTLANGAFDQTIEISFTHQAVPGTFSDSTTVRAFGNGQTVVQELSSPDLSY